MAHDDTLTWSAILQDAMTRVGAGDARRIVEEVVGVEPGRLHTVLERPATVLGVARFDRLIRRRAAGEPLQYVLGRWGFRSLDLMVDRRVLIPRPETEVVAGLAIDEITRRSSVCERDLLVADLGTGSGAIALSIAAECPRTRVLATDVSPDALTVASANLAGIGRAATRVSLHHGDWFDALPDAARGSLDVIVANPPYVSDEEPLPAVVSDWEPAFALRSGPDGLRDLRSIVDTASHWLAESGVLVLEMAPQQTAIVADWCRDRGFEAEVRPDLTGRERAVVARRGAIR